MKILFGKWMHPNCLPNNPNTPVHPKKQHNMNTIEAKKLFDQVALGCISYLESFEECKNIFFQSNKECANHEFTAWEKRNTPIKLPDDMKKCYSLFNGFILRWEVEITNSLVPIGELRLNCLEDIKSSNTIDFIVQQNLPLHVQKPVKKQCTLFVIDSHSEVGNIVLLYRLPSDAKDQNVLLNQPEVWLMDRSGQLIYLAATFTQYVRLMVVHLGIYGWQMVFSDDGLMDVTQHWMALFCKERLIVDRHYLASR